MACAYRSGQRRLRNRPLDHPRLSLDRIDILVDGASATYGSDALAGVITLF